MGGIHMKKIRVMGCLLICLTLMLQGCGSKNSEEAAYDMAQTTSSELMMQESTEEAPAAGYENSDQLYVTKAEEKPIDTPTEPVEAEEVESDLNYRKLIKTVDMTVETEEFDVLMTNLEENVKKLGGYIENVSTNSNREAINRYSSMTLRIPVLQLEQFVTSIQDSSNVLYHNEYVQDVTLTYVDMESHKKALQAEQDTLLRLLDKAETIEDIIQIESRLSDVRYQIESLESQLRTYDNLIAYSTVYLSISEVERETIIAKDDPWTEMTTGFMDSYYKIMDGFKNFGIDFVINLPYIIIYVILLGGGFLIGLLLFKRGKKKQLKLGQPIQPVQNVRKEERSEDEPKL